jgi:hypothetical protein
MTETSSSKRDPREVYADLREMAFRLTRSSRGIPAGASPLEPFGVILEMGVEHGTATLVAFVDGSASLYFSSGAVALKGRGQSKINDAANDAVRTASEFVAQMQPASDFSLPSPKEHALYVLTDDGPRSERGHEGEFMSTQHRLAPLWIACQDVLTQFRLLRQRVQ